MTDQCFYVPRFSFTNFKCICMMGQEKEIHSIGDKNTILEWLDWGLSPDFVYFLV